MKKYIIFLVLNTILSVGYSQQKKEVCGEVLYVHSTHFSRDFSRDFLLKFNNHNSIYKEKNAKAVAEKTKQLNNEQGQQLIREMSRSNLNPDFFYNNRSSFYFMEVWFNQELLVKEDSFNWNWNLKNEYKKVGKFNCQKATIKFRGRDYIAWFTNDIPVIFGPWKFQGLSGLILEIYDVDNVLHIIAKEIKIENKTACNIEIDSSKFKTALSIKQFLKKKIKLIKEDFAKISSRLPKGYTNLVYDENNSDGKEEIELFKPE